MHDALYQLMRDGQLDVDKFRKPADRLLKKMGREDGMFLIRFWWVFLGVDKFGSGSANPSHKGPIIRAPK